ncbi:MAG: glycosyltransferase [Bacteroidota bacterium]
MTKAVSPFISLIVCTYNREKFLGDCLDSILAQSLDIEQYEVIVINNKSTDSTAEILQQFAARAPANWSFLLEKQQGLSYARNRGIQEAKGVFLTYVDDDAILATNYLQLQFEHLQLHPELAGLGGKILAKFEGPKPAWFNPYTAPTYFSHYDRGDKSYVYREGDFPFGCNMCLRKSLIEPLGGFDTDLGRIGKGGLGGEEKKLFGQIINAGGKVRYLPELWVHHQVDHYRTQRAYVEKISRGLGVSHRLLYCGPETSSWSCFKANLRMRLKLVAAHLLSFKYRLQGNKAVGPHLVQFRRWVLEEFLKKAKA